MNIEAALAMAETALEDVEPAPAPLDAEKAAIKTYCQKTIRKKAIAAEGAEERKKLKSEANRAKKQIMEYMAQREMECMVLSREDFKRLEEATSDQGVPMVPLYCRMVRTNRDANVTQAVIDDAIESVSVEDITDLQATGKTFAEALQMAILMHVRHAIRSFTTSLKATDVREKGTPLYEVPEVPQELVKAVVDMHMAGHKLKAAAADNKAEISEVTKDLNALKPAVQQFFERTGVMSQRVLMDNVPYRIARKVSVRHEKIGVTKVEAWLTEAVKGVNSLADFQRKTNAIKTALVRQLQSVPPTTKTEISLQAVRQKA